ncbi:hypothetical protein KH388_10145 [Serratia rubidaea]|nr:hypothetical protein [Serratia rubidaea]
MKDQKAEILRLKQEGKGYKTISRLTGVNLNTVKTTCRRSGLFRDNPEHRVLFTIPERKYSTAVAVPKPLPPQRTITGDKQTDAYLWVLEVIKTGEPAHIAAAEEALKKLTITPKLAQENYTLYLQAQGAGWTSVFSTMWMDSPQHYIDQAKAQYEKACAVRGVFGSYEAVMEPTEAERRMLAEYGDVYDDECYGWSDEERQQGSISGNRVLEAWDERRAASKGFADILPTPYTLSDVVREFEYWSWLCSMRSAARKEIDPAGYDDGDGPIADREDWLDKQLEVLRPRDQREALAVLKWYLQSERHQGSYDADSDTVYLNLIGVHEDV